ncbi:MULTISPECIES: GIY-YIG nuclease family protein [Cyanophyceae]|uniref:GIY-YIG nuclease family protein n=1 Tax=Cyanophyceae TaxID=3028117 RepID=UPI0016885D66|nr:MULTISPECIES: GIY-YIG nuclease family protein [Cyanophyceae]MBD1915289.1 GIY-YIG nuclease family protein [Phormidium sp. FACHB-77]MBD2032434.1 GIY-YIG nuclease family protein [Phormidium sp. FACHB-322]MBD2051035.1 GIY-YIG nuclease family protein [Leptolyngbya sp. FACHB-60]
MPDYQPSLLSDADLRAADLSWAYNRPAGSAMLADELQSWKQRVAQFQATVKADPSVQGTLFDVVDASPADTIDPFALPPQNAEFWRGQFQESGVPALYFVVDHDAAVLLYVGETVKSNQRWKGVHDCKRYILSYVEAHRVHQLPVAVNIGFWPHADCDRKARQTLEQELIRHWRSPFNKENWATWSTPFVGGKLEA